jgi:hypothetical protein
LNVGESTESGIDLEDQRRKRVLASGRVEPLCTLCEVEGRPYVRADCEYVVVSTLGKDEKRITVCSDHSSKLDNDRLPYRVVRQRKGVDWAHPL